MANAIITNGDETMTSPSIFTGVATMSHDVELTVSSYYEGTPVPFTTIMSAMGCTADDITRAVHDGLLRVSRKSIGSAGRLLRGVAALHVVPAWA